VKIVKGHGRGNRFRAAASAKEQERPKSTDDMRGFREEPAGGMTVDDDISNMFTAYGIQSRVPARCGPRYRLDTDRMSSSVNKLEMSCQGRPAPSSAWCSDGVRQMRASSFVRKTMCGCSFHAGYSTIAACWPSGCRSWPSQTGATAEMWVAMALASLRRLRQWTRA